MIEGGSSGSRQTGLNTDRQTDRENEERGRKDRTLRIEKKERGVKERFRKKKGKMRWGRGARGKAHLQECSEHEP